MYTAVQPMTLREIWFLFDFSYTIPIGRVQSRDSDHPWILLRKPRIFGLRSKSEHHIRQGHSQSVVAWRSATLFSKP